MELIYHYTIGAKLPLIFLSGKLEVSPWEKSQKIKNPALWLSLNKIWEPTSAKMALQPNGQSKTLTMEEHEIPQIGGLYRFVLPFNKKELCSWSRYKHATDIDLDYYNSLEIVGISQGANPKDWYASFDDIPLSGVIALGKWDNGKWDEMDMGEVIEMYKKAIIQLKSK